LFFNLPTSALGLRVSIRESKVKCSLQLNFKPKFTHGLIQVPDEYKQELSEGDDIKVIIVVTKKSPREKDIIDELTENPIEVNGILNRDEIYSRQL
jgi:hypothetical protein